MASVAEVQKHDTWATAEGEADAGPFLLRFRTPVVSRGETRTYRHQLLVCWPYAEEDIGAMPSDYETEAMAAFQHRLCDAWERDGMAFLAAVLTFDGARQWVFYAKDVDECEERLDALLEDEEAYPIELTVEEDPEWKYLRGQVLGVLDLREHEAGWEESLRRARAASG